LKFWTNVCDVKIDDGMVDEDNSSESGFTFRNVVAGVAATNVGNCDVDVNDASPVGESGLKDLTAAAKKSALEDVGRTNVGVDILATLIGPCSTLIGFDLYFISLESHLH